MFDLTESYDSLVAIRRTAADVHEFVSQRTRDELEAARWMFEGRVKIALMATPDDALEEAIESLDREYNNVARGELEALM